MSNIAPGNGVYLNQGFNGAQTPIYSITPHTQRPVTPRPGCFSRNRLLIMGITVIGIVVFLALSVALVGVILANLNTDNNSKQEPLPQPIQAPFPQPTQPTLPQPTASPITPSYTIEGDIFNTGICGTRPALDNRILGGSIAKLSAWPWIGSLMVESEQSCGVTLINSRWAVTAAHCIVDPGVTVPTSIIFGHTTLSTPGSFSQQSGFVEMMTHPMYNSSDPLTEYDITLLYLRETIDFNSYVRPVCLATKDQESSVYNNCYAAGWGALSDPETTDADYPDILQEVYLPLLSQDECKALDDITDNILCAGATSQGETGSCQGDSGGPLVCESTLDNRRHLVGITSSGSGCGLPNTPDLYTRVSQFITWIKNEIAVYS